ncbi:MULTISPECIES: ACP S-malonyltransferase [unclassified Bradyrhizobium]|uniref:ACP S-malonyltransferase n=1 Tax=unclassified Bradyrhizobium TaxID=2631580 RepID=UPI00291667EA|nr:MULTISPECIES: ACP S-malonyltransferase [unclassified Bradyrhizobium]
MAVLVFPGQGSQCRGMGKGLFDEVEEFAAVEREINEIVGYSVRELCLNDATNQLTQTQYTQPCLYIVNALHYYKAIREGQRVDAVVGHSLGEYNALLAAGSFDLVTGVKLVQKRGELMARARNGGMGAVIGLEAARIVSVLFEQRLLGIDLANFNSQAQTVIAGPVDELKRAGPLLQAAGARAYVPLPVSAAFHSRYMAGAAQAYHEFLATFTFAPLKVTVISNATARPYPTGDQSSAVCALLVKQITQPVLWLQSIKYLLNEGETEFREVGPGTALTRLLEQIRQSS